MSGAEFDCQYEASDEASESELLDRSLSVWTGWSTLERKEDYAPIALDLHTASSIGQYDRVRNIIQRADEDLNRKNLGGWTPLMYACYIGHDNIVNLLLDAGVSVNVRNNKGQTPLMLAASCGNESVAYFLLQQGADLEAKDKKSWTALFHATYSGHQNVVKFLLDSGADTEVVEPSREFTPLMEAAAEGHEIIVQCLLQHGVDVNARSCRGDTARSLALYHGHTKIVSLIDNYCLMPRQARKETGVPQRAPADLSSSDEAVQIPRGQSSRGSRSKNRGPRIQDGPQAFDRLMEKQGSPSSVQEERPSATGAKGAPAEFVPRAYVPSGYYTFPYDGKSQPVQHIRSRDILSPINPEDETLDSSGGREIREFDDGSPFSKTGALTIKSSSGSSGGLAGALGLYRDSCEDLDYKDTPHLKTIHTGIDNLHITESENKDSDHKGETVSAYSRNSKTSESGGRTKEKRKKSKRHDKSSSDHVRSVSLTGGTTCAVHEHLERFTREDITQPEKTHESVQYKSLTNERSHGSERRSASERTVHYNVENRVSHVAKDMLVKETEIRIPERRHSRGMLGKAPQEYDDTWTRPHDLGSLLDAIGMSKYLHIFEEQDVDMQVFLSLTDNDLKEVGIKLFGPRRKMTNAIARWHSNVRPSGNDLEQAYADKLEAEMQEMAIQLHRSCEQTEQLKAQLLQEQELRSVTEGCLMDDRSAWQYVRRLAANTRQLCDEMQHLFQHSSLCQEELSRRLCSGTSAGEHKAPSGDQQENQGGGSFKNSPADLTNLSTSKILSRLQSINDQVQRHLVSSSINMDEMLGQELDYDRIENYS